MRILVAFLLCFGVFACSEQSEETLIDETIIIEKPKTENGLRVITIENGPESFGYQILENGKVIINQVNIPAIQGNHGFSSREKAQKTGEFALHKIKNGFFPPTITPEEMDSLGVL